MPARYLQLNKFMRKHFLIPELKTLLQQEI